MGISKNGGVPAVAADPFPDSRLRLSADLAVAEKFQMLGPGNGYQHPERVFDAEVEEPARGDIIDSQEVHTHGRGEAHVPVRLFRIAEVLAMGIRGKGAVGDPFDKKLAVSLKEEFCPDTNRAGRRIHGRHFKRQGGWLVGGAERGNIAVGACFAQADFRAFPGKITRRPRCCRRSPGAPGNRSL